MGGLTMSAKQPPKSEENFKNKVIRLFQRKTATHQTVLKSHSKDFIITPQILKDVGPECPANNRIKNILQLCEVVRHKQLEENATEALWMAIKDLVEPKADLDSRHQALVFLCYLLEGQLKFLGILRGHFFKVIEKLEQQEDLSIKLQLFKIISEDGRNLLDFEEETGPFLLKMMPDALTAGLITQFLHIIINIVKYNAAYIDEEIMSGFVQQTCMIQNRTRSDEDMKLCQQVLDTVICYSYLPSDSLHHFVAALCHMVNKPRFSHESWEIMKKLLGTHLGHKTIYTMCCILQDKQQPMDSLLLRGAVFFTGMALWGSKRVITLKHTAASVLPSFYQVLDFRDGHVSQEVILNVQRLVSKYGKDLTHMTWDIIFDILQKLLSDLDMLSLAEPTISSEVHAVLTEMENLYQHGHFLGHSERIFELVEACASKRPLESVYKFIDHHMHDIHPGKDKWIQNLNKLLENFFRNDTRTEVRKKALDMLSFVLSVNKHVYEVELIKKVVIPHFSHIDTDPDVEVRKVATDILLVLAQGCSHLDFFDLISIIEKMIRKPLTTHFRQPSDRETIIYTDEQNIEDVKLAVLKIIEVFQHKLYTAPPSHCQRLYELIISHMQAHYTHGYNMSAAAAIRKAVLELLLQLRSDSMHRMGLVNRCSSNGCTYSPYALCSGSDFQAPVSPIAASLAPAHMFAVIDYSQTLELFINSLKQENDWPVLSTLLAGLPSVLENKTLVLSTGGHLVYKLCGQLCDMVKFQISTKTRGFPRQLLHVPDGFKRSDFDDCVLPVIAAMVTYHQFLDKNRQFEMVKCLEFGLVSGIAKVCVTSLRICSLEIQKLMMRMLPSVLLSLSKITATMAMAIPVLAFLSSIVRLPQLYVNFVEDQYMSVFAIALPYTNPFKFSHYTVSMAHHVIAVWFIRCRIPFRKGFVKFVQRGLRANVLQQFEENAQLKLSQQNQDSSNRSRSGSEGASSRRRMVSGSDAAHNDKRNPMDEKMAQFHKELTETCMDVMSRYTFGNVTNVYHRSAMTQFLLQGGLKDTWLMGNKLITITTSGGRGKDNNSGLCSKCLALLQQTQQDEKQKSRQERRRRHKSAGFMRSTSETYSDYVMISHGENGVGMRGDEKGSRWARDDLSLLTDQNHDDAAVQTGSSLSSGQDTDSLESMLLSWKSQIEEKSVLAADPCPCWCAGWAEVVIRGPSGNIAWVMRIENMPPQHSIHNDPSEPDIIMLFAPVNTKSPDSESIGKLDSGSLGEEEYGSVHASVFGLELEDKNQREQRNVHQEDSESRDLPTPVPETTPPSVGTEAVSIPSPACIRRSNSSPFLSHPDLEGLSPKEMIANLLKSSDQHPDENVTIRIDSSESRVNVAAENFEGFDLAEKPEDSVRHCSFTKHSPQDTSGTDPKKHFCGGREFTLEAKERTQWPNVQAPAAPYTSTSSANNGTDKDKVNRAIGRSSSTLQARLHDYDLKQQDSIKIHDKHGSGPSVVQTSEYPANITFCERPRLQTSPMIMRGRQLETLPLGAQMKSPDSSSSSSAQEGLLDFHLKKRGHTISIMTHPDSSRQQEQAEVDLRTGGPGKDFPWAVTPAEVFLQLYHTHPLIASQDQPLHLPNDEKFDRALVMLDHIYPYETHKIGVVYIGPGQVKDEKAFLSNVYGSSRYIDFMQGLGRLVKLEDVDQSRVYLGGLSQSDGKFAYTWQDESMQVIFHIATLMPNKKGDPNCNSKKLHIGNDYVSIVYNDSGEDFTLGTISGAFNYVNIIIRPLDHESNAVTLITKQDIADILGHTHPKIISDTNLPLLVRQIAVHCNLASRVLQRQQLKEQEPFASNWLERLRQIKRIRQRLTEHLNAGAATTGQNYGWVHGVSSRDNPETLSKFVMEDFTDYV